MKLSKLLNALLERSNSKNQTEVSEVTKVPQSTVNRMFLGEGTTEKYDLVFDELTKDVSSTRSGNQTPKIK